MAGLGLTNRHEVQPAAPARRDGDLRDLRFRALLGAEAWARLPGAVQERFSKRLGPGQAVTYVGRIVECRRSRCGALLAQACRLIGAPLPLADDVDVPAVVTVTEDEHGAGQFWSRMYGRARGFPQVIHSSKRFAGPTGLEEYLGCGFGIALLVRADAEAIHFQSDHYFLKAGRLRLRLPAWLAPGALIISHVDRGPEGFAFVLTLRHPALGELIHQTGMFQERAGPVELSELQAPR